MQLQIQMKGKKISKFEKLNKSACSDTLSIILMNSLFAIRSPVGGLRFKSELKVTKYIDNTQF